MAGIIDRSRCKQFQRMSTGKSKEEKRELEVKLLRPEKIPEYKGDISTNKNPLLDRSVTIIFPSIKEFERFASAFPVRRYSGNNLSNIDFLMSLVKDIEDRKIQYDKESGRINYPRISTLGKKKPGSGIKRG